MNHSNHAFKNFDQSLAAIDAALQEAVQKILAMNQLNLQALQLFADKAGAKELLSAAKAMDKEINGIEFQIVALIQNILGKYNPRGRDLRFIIGSIKLSTLLESIADKIKNNIKRIYKTETIPAAQVVEGLSEMLMLSEAMMQSVSQLMRQWDGEISDEINRKRRRIEALYREIWLRETSVDTTYHNLVMLAKNIERNADMVSDLKKIIYFMETGEKLVKKKKLMITE